MSATFWVALCGFSVSLLLTPIVRELARRLNVLDVPNARSSHARPTPRSGGLAIIGGIAAGVVAERGTLDGQAIIVLCGALILAIMSAVDDVRGLPARVRFLGQSAVAALVAMFAGLSLDAASLGGSWLLQIGILGLFLSWFWLVGVSNAFNFMDGINGIAASGSVICGGTYAILASRTGSPADVLLATAVASAAAGFLVWNVRGSIFMGDAGSITLGFVLAALALDLAVNEVSVVAVTLPLAPFLLDTGVTLVRRIARRETIFSAHRSHYYQRLVASGWSHLQATALWSLLALMGSAVALYYDTAPPALRASSLAGLLLLHVTSAILIDRRERRSALG